MTETVVVSPLTYRELQGVDQIEAAYATLSGPGLERAPFVAAQCVELIFFNCSDLFARIVTIAAAREDGFFPACLRFLVWIDELLDLAWGFARLARLDRGDAARTPSRGLARFAREYARCEQLMLRRLDGERESFRRAIQDAGADDPLSATVHCLKNIHHLSAMVADKLNAADAASTNERASRELEHAVFERGAGADNLLMQFRLLHQIPELCALLMVDLLGACDADLEAGRLSEIPERLDVIGGFFLLIIQCNRPVRNLMLPAEYYLIRHRFGQTSGSQSAAISRNLLGRSYLKLAKSARAQLGDASSPQARQILRELQTISTMVADWRQSHLSFPRNLLGGFGTASLAGAPDGLESAETMMQAFAKKDPLKPCAAAAAIAHPGAALDTALLQLTASVAQNIYEDVQARARRSRNAPDSGS